VTWTWAISEVAHQSALIPLGWLTLRRTTVPVHLWWIASAFAVSWLPDLWAHWGNPWIGSLLYPLTQSMLIALVFVDRPRPALDLLVGLVAVGLVAAWWNGRHPGPDVLFHSAAFGMVTVIAWKRPQLGMLRTSLLVSFGLWLVCWWCYVAFATISTPLAWATWGAFQTARLVGMVLFCIASVRPQPRLQVA